MIALAITLALQPAAQDSVLTAQQMAAVHAESERLNRIRALSDDQALIVYDQCLARGAAKASHTAAPEDAIFNMAYAGCLPLRIDLLANQPAARFLAFKSLDDAKRASFPALTKQLREQRNARATSSGVPEK